MYPHKVIPPTAKTRTSCCKTPEPALHAYNMGEGGENDLLLLTPPPPGLYSEVSSSFSPPSPTTPFPVFHLSLLPSSLLLKNLPWKIVQERSCSRHFCFPSRISIAFQSNTSTDKCSSTSDRELSVTADRKMVYFISRTRPATCNRIQLHPFHVSCLMW